MHRAPGTREVGITTSAGAERAGAVDAARPARRFPRPARPAASGRPLLSIAGLAASIGLIAYTARLGPSAVEPPLPGGAALPPYAAVGRPPSDTLVVALLVVAVAVGCAGLAGALRALRRGWEPRLRALVVAGIAATALLALVPPIGSADLESYAAYGHLAATGRDPYATTPAAAYRRDADPVAAAVEPPWQHATSVYGPLATGEQWLAARIGGRSVRTTVAVLAWISAGAFLAVGILLLLLAPTAAARRRAAVLWLVNPLMLLSCVAGAHLDVLVALGAVAAVGVAVRRPAGGWAGALLAGALAGLAVDVKATAAFVVLGLAWSLRRRPRAAASLVAGAALTVVPAYLLAGGHVLDQARTAAHYASSGTPWRWVASALDASVHAPTSRTVLSVLVAVTTLALLARLRPRTGEPPPAAAALAALVGYLFATAYVLPWYDAPAWALLALVPATGVRAGGLPRITTLLLAHTGALSAAYLTRDLPLSSSAHALVTGLRSGLAPVTVLAVLLATVTVATSLLRTGAADGSVSPAVTGNAARSRLDPSPELDP